MDELIVLNVAPPCPKNFFHRGAKIRTHGPFKIDPTVPSKSHPPVPSKFPPTVTYIRMSPPAQYVFQLGSNFTPPSPQNFTPPSPKNFIPPYPQKITHGPLQIFAHSPFEISPHGTPRILCCKHSGEISVFRNCNFLCC